MQSGTVDDKAGFKVPLVSALAYRASLGDFSTLVLRQALLLGCDQLGIFFG